mmetsp:Transcript_110472/g.356580  ORF Transcript_110472/g.356580 Transcript_110472/m.356580 type:complete len:217 (+) Transcript_110472:325-975(+)
MSVRYVGAQTSSSQTSVSRTSCGSTGGLLLSNMLATSHCGFPKELPAGKVPSRKVRCPPRVSPRCSNEVAPSLCERPLNAVGPHRTWASRMPRCLWLRKHATMLSNSLPRPLALNPGSVSRARLSPISPSMITFQQHWFTARKAITKASRRGGARDTVRAPGIRGTKISALCPSCGSVCQSAFSSDCCHLSCVKSQPAKCWPCRDAAKGPRGSSRT